MITKEFTIIRERGGQSSCPTCIKNFKQIDIIAGYFTIESLLEVAEGLEVFLNSSGKIDLIIGVPQKGLDSMNENLVEALKLVDNPMSIEEIKNDFEKLYMKVQKI